MLENENNNGLLRGNLYATENWGDAPAHATGLVNPFLIIFRNFLFFEDNR